ncbi:hypothetical protein RI138_26635 [Streptomyces sp. C11-1]|uniref:ATP-binding protein n=1 Tax=Streptomyces durocortorensis TaxID=2811104 RepID=A0ABY9W2U4_9ACTN|nr:hypothetical protein [Streptomyces durocortorensis]WNF30120.1 hypothetical protein RI138_26635 [Streptomyces durocortorensis]
MTPDAGAPPEWDFAALIDAIGGAAGAAGASRPFVYAPHGNINAGSVHGDQQVHNASAREGRGRRAATVREGPIPEAEVRAAAFGFAEPDWFGPALGKLRPGPLFLVGRPGSGRRTAALNLLRQACGEDAPLRALDGVTELDRWEPTDSSARGYLMDGLFPNRPLGSGVLGHVRSLLEQAEARMVIVLPDDAALLHRLEHDLHIRPTFCEPPPPARVFGSHFEAAVPGQHERERLLAALGHRHELGDLLVPELVPAEVVELVSAIVAADGDPDALGDVRARLSYRAEREVPQLIAELFGDPDALAFLLAACVFEGLDHRIVREEADRLLELSQGRLTAMLPATDAQGAEKAERPNPGFVFRRPLTELLRAVRATRQTREIRTEGAYAHSVEAVTFVRHRQAEAVLRHVWREYGQLSDLLVAWLGEVHRSGELTRPVGEVMGRAASWGGGRRALRHIGALAGAERTTGRLIAAHALGIAAEDPVLAAEVRYRLQQWSVAADFRLRTTVAYTCGAEFGLSRPAVALKLLRTLVLGGPVRDGAGQEAGDRVRMAVRAATLQLFRAGNEERVFGHLLDWLDAEQSDTEQLLVTFGQLLQYPRWFQWHLAEGSHRGRAITDTIHLALNTDVSFDTVCAALLNWSQWGQWDGKLGRAVENLFASLARSLRPGEFRLFVEMEEKGVDGWAGLEIARDALGRWRYGERGGRRGRREHGGHGEPGEAA